MPPQLPALQRRHVRLRRQRLLLLLLRLLVLVLVVVLLGRRHSLALRRQLPRLVLPWVLRACRLSGAAAASCALLLPAAAHLEGGLCSHSRIRAKLVHSLCRCMEVQRRFLGTRLCGTMAAPAAHVQSCLPVSGSIHARPASPHACRLPVNSRACAVSLDVSGNSSFQPSLRRHRVAGGQAR